MKTKDAFELRENKPNQTQFQTQRIEVPEPMVVDHINHDGMDNRKANLREATCAQNSWSSGKSRGVSRSKYKGPAWDSRDRRWEVRISVNGRRIYIGRFKEEIEAARAYDAAAVEYHGRYANVNFET